MKRFFLSVILASLFFVACNNAPEGEKAVVAEEQAVKVTADGTAFALQDGSTITFTGATPTHEQVGTFPANGLINVTDGVITGGSANVELANMNVITEGLADEKKEKLKSHLLNEDFFNVKANPSVKFEITEVKAIEAKEGENTHNISGNLTMNGQTNNISFPAKVLMQEGQLSATSSFVINRKNWGMSYKNDKSLGDEWIYDEVKLSIEIKAAK